MAKHTFVTESHMTGDEKKTVDIPTRAEIKRLAAEAMEIAETAMSSELRKIAKAVEVATKKANAAATEAAAARDEVTRLVENAREEFRAAIAEVLAPHYRLLAEHLGITPPPEIEEASSAVGKKGPTRPKKRTVARKKKPATRPRNRSRAT